MALHKDLTGANLHEPKGVASASDGQVYVADGSGSGVWSTLSLPTGQFLVNTLSFTASGTWTKPDNLIAIKVLAVGGGGASTNTSTNGRGGSTSFGTFITCTGGQRGQQDSGVHGTSTGGDVNFSGVSWGTSSSTSIIAPTFAVLINGYGSGGWPASTTQTGGAGGSGFRWIKASDLASTVAVTVGSGGTGSSGNASGQQGIVIIEQFIQVV